MLKKWIAAFGLIALSVSPALAYDYRHDCDHDNAPAVYQDQDYSGDYDDDDDRSDQGYESAWLQDQREERYLHDVAHERHVREGLYDEMERERAERDAHDEAHWRHAQEGWYGWER